jgi:hypothetical protein
MEFAKVKQAKSSARSISFQIQEMNFPWRQMKQWNDNNTGAIYV